MYERGDILDMSNVRAVPGTTGKPLKAPNFDECKKALVLSSCKKENGCFNYTILGDDDRVYCFKSVEQGNEKFIKHIDLF